MLKKEDALREEHVPGKSRKFHSVFIFACTGCGNEIRVWRGSLPVATGKCASCANRTRPFGYTYTILCANNRHKGIPVELSYEEFLEFTRLKNCHYCRSPIPWEPFSRSGGYKKAYFLDRKDHSKGYTKSNCVVCCTSCNFTRQLRFTYEEFMLLAPGLRRITKLRKSGTEHH